MVLCIGMGLVFHFTSCKKNKSAVAGEPVLEFPTYSDLPYDTSGIDGVLSVNLLFDSTKEKRESNLYFTAWFTQKTTQGFRDSLVIYANGRSLAGNGNYFTAAIGKYDPGMHFIPDTSIAWSVNAGVGNMFTYTATDTFPAYHLGLPDTIATGRNDTFRFDSNLVHYADIVLVKLIVPGGQTILYPVATTGRVALDKGLISGIANKDIGVTVSVFNRQSLIFNNKKYLFVKEYTLGRNVWFK